MSTSITSMDPQTMANLLAHIPPEVIRAYQPRPADELPNIDHLITEDETPVDNLYSAKQQKLLEDPLGLYREVLGPYLAATNVGLFNNVNEPIPIVPDFFFSKGVRAKGDPLPKRNRSYFFWEYGKPPEVVIEIVSNTEGKEDTDKMQKYAELAILYYVIWDPANILKQGQLRVYVLQEKKYVLKEDAWFPVINLGLKIWQGVYDDWDCVWLRWCDQNGHVLPTGEERAKQEAQRTEQERQRADKERQRAEEEKRRTETERQQAEKERQGAEMLAAKLRSLGIDPEEVGS